MQRDLMKYTVFKEVIYVFVSLLFYLLSPIEYNYSLVLMMMIFYLVIFRHSLLTLLVKDNYINFSLFFSISFFFVNFFYPVFIYPVQKDYFVVFERFNFDHNVITISTSLALLGYSCFILGQKIGMLKTELISIKREKLIQDNKLRYFFSFINVICIMSTFLLFIFGFEGILSRRSDAFSHVEASFMVIAQCSINLVIILFFYLKKNIMYLVIPSIYTLIFLYIGDRGAAIQAVLIGLLSFHLYYKEITKKKFLLILLFGFISLTFLSSIRSSVGNVKTISEVQIGSYYDFAMDLVVNNRNLYAGYEYVEKRGVNYGKTSFIYLFAPFPMLPSIVSQEFFDAKPSELSSSSILTGEANAGWGLGTNLIADLYMQYHVLGVIFFMFLLGYIVKVYEVKMERKFTAIIVTFFLFSFSIYMPRSSMLDSIRYIFWAFAFYYFIYFFFKPNYQK